MVLVVCDVVIRRRVGVGVDVDRDVCGHVVVAVGDEGVAGVASGVDVDLDVGGLRVVGVGVGIVVVGGGVGIASGGYVIGGDCDC